MTEFPREVTDAIKRAVAALVADDKFRDFVARETIESRIASGDLIPSSQLTLASGLRLMRVEDVERLERYDRDSGFVPDVPDMPAADEEPVEAEAGDEPSPSDKHADTPTTCEVCGADCSMNLPRRGGNPAITQAELSYMRFRKVLCATHFAKKKITKTADKKADDDDSTG